MSLILLYLILGVALYSVSMFKLVLDAINDGEKQKFDNGALMRGLILSLILWPILLVRSLKEWRE